MLFLLALNKSENAHQRFDFFYFADNVHMYYNNNNNNFIVPIKDPQRGRELHIKQILIQCTYNNTTLLCQTESETK